MKNALAAVLGLLLLAPLAVADPPAPAAPASAAIENPCEKARTALAKHKKRARKARRRYFKTHASTRQRKAFVKRQKAKTRRLKRRVGKRCAVAPPVAPQPSAPAPPRPAAPRPGTPPAPRLTLRDARGAVITGTTVTYRPGMPARFGATAAGRVTFPALGAGWGGGATGPTTATYTIGGQRLLGRVGDAATLHREGGGAVTPGRYEVVVDDTSATKGFRLYGPGVDEVTAHEFVGEATWTVDLEAGATYRYGNTLDHTLAVAPKPADPGTRHVVAPTGARAAFTVRADATAPATTVRCDGAPCAQSTYGKAVSVTLAATDAGAGVAQIRYTLDGSVPTADTGAVYQGAFPVTASTTVRYRAFDRVGNAEPVAEREIAIAPPPDTLQAPPADPTVPMHFTDATEFLYTGPNAVQTGVAPGTIEARRVAVVRGRVTDRLGKPLAGVEVTVLDHPELGRTLTREGGHFDLAVNGGGAVTLTFEKPGVLPVQRAVDAPWQDFVLLEEDIVMTPYDERVTEIDLASPEPIQTARGSEQADRDGERQATVMFRSGTEATMTLEDGSKVPLDTLDVRATEYTVGARGPDAMPGELPATTGYTYAVELSVDQAEEAGATQVDFSKPVAFYLENFLDFNVGSAVPVGWYDRTKGHWVPSENGRVVAVVGESGGRAQLDLDGDGSAETGERLTELGVTDAELAEVAELYEPGESLWRVQIDHFTPLDCNWLARSLPRNPNPDDPDGDGERDDFPEPDVDDPTNQEEQTDEDCQQRGSVIDCENRVLGQDVALTGTPLRLHYGSDRVPGRKADAALHIPVTGEHVPDGVKRVEVQIDVAGVRHTRTFSGRPNQDLDFTWNGMGAYGRRVSGGAKAAVQVSYVYPTYRQQQIDELIQEGERVRVELNYFARMIPANLYADLDAGIDTWAAQTRELGRAETSVPRWWSSEVRQDGNGSLGTWDARGAGLGGWTLDVHHAYDPATRSVYLGDGGRRSAVGVRQIMQTIAGNGKCDDAGPDGPAREAVMCSPDVGAVTPDGTVYVAPSRHVYKVTPDGTATRVAGNGMCDGIEEGEPALEAGLCQTQDLDVAPDGTIYVASDDRIYRIDTAGRIHRYAGFGWRKEGPADEVHFDGVDGIELSAAGGMYVTAGSTGRLLYVGPDGVASIVAGGADHCWGVLLPADEDPTGPVERDNFCARGDVVEGPDQSVYVVADWDRILRIRPDGQISRFAGGGTEDADGVDATDAWLSITGRGHLAMSADGALYIPENGRIRRVGADGVITTVAGTPPGVEESDEAGDGGIATDGGVIHGDSVAVAPDGSLFLEDADTVRKVTTPLPGLADRPISIPSADGVELWQFDRHGRHVRTVESLTGVPIWTFGYDDAGRLVKVTDRAGQDTVIERAGDGTPEAIVAPGGQRTELTLRGDGFLTRVENPEDEGVTIGYGSSGLLTSMTNAEDEASTYEYDALGRLRVVRDAEGGQRTYATAITADRAIVTVSSKAGRTAKYEMSRRTDGLETRTVTGADGLATVSRTLPDGSRETTYPGGTTETIEYGPDPRFGMLAPLVRRQHVKMPGGRTSTVESTREVTLRNDDPSAGVAAQTDTAVVNGDTYVRAYDGDARTVTGTTPEGRTTVTKLDALGRPVETGAVGLAPAVTTYDEETGLVTKVQQGDQFWAFAYGADRLVETRTDAAGKQIRYERDDAGRVTQLTLPTGRVHTIAYDDAGRVETTTLPAAEEGAARPEHRAAYTKVGALKEYRSPTGDAFGTSWNTEQQRTGNTLPGREAHVFTHTPEGRLKDLSYGEATIGYGYDASGQMREVTRTPKGAGQAQKLESSYDGVLLSSLTASGAADGTFTYQWTDDHLLDGLTVEGEAIDIDRDDDGLMTKYGPFTFTRGGPNGEETAIAGGPGALRVDVALDDHGRIESRTHKLGATQLYRVDLTYDDRGRIETRTEAVGASAPDTLTYAYDDDGRLLGARRGAEVLEAYEYDGRGNRRLANGEAATFTADDRVIERAGVAYEYDAAGFLRSRGSHAFTYSSRGELLEATVGGETVTYAYDAMGRRTARTAGGKTTEYLYGSPDDPFQLTASRHDGVLTTYFYSEKGHLFAYKRGGATFYVMTDQTGSPRRVVNQAGTVVKTVEYDSFGRVLAETGTETLVHGFAGGLADPVTGLVRMGMRDYDPAAGRWTAKNPLLFGGGSSNLYTYAGNNPVNVYDPSGLPSMSLSAGAGAMFGVKGAWNDQGFSFCWEFGAGLGSSVELDLETETLDADQSRLFASGEVGAGPLKGSLEYEYDTLGGPCMEGEGKWKPKACFFVCYGDSDGVTVENPYMPSPDLGKLGQKMKGMFKGKGASAQIKAGVRVCKSSSW